MPGEFDESLHPRDSAGKFAKKEYASRLRTWADRADAKRRKVAAARDAASQTSNMTYNEYVEANRRVTEARRNLSNHLVGFPKPPPGVRTKGLNVVKLRDRTPAEIAAARAQNAKDLPEKTAQRLDEMFGDRVPTLSDFERGYGLDNGARAELDVRPTGRGIRVQGNHVFVDEHGNEHKMFQAMSRDYVGNPGDPGAFVYHDHLSVEREFRASGIGRQVLSNSVRMHHELGYRKILTEPVGSYSNESFETWEEKNKANKANWDAYKRGEKSFAQMREDARQLDTGYIGPYAWATYGFKHEGSYEDAFNDYVRKHHFDEFARAVLGPEKHAKASATKADTKLARSKHVRTNLTDDDRAAVFAAIDLFTSGLQQGRDIVGVVTPSGTRVGAHFMACFASNPHETWEMDMVGDPKGWNIMKKRLGLMDLDP